MIIKFAFILGGVFLSLSLGVFLLFGFEICSLPGQHDSVETATLLAMPFFVGGVSLVSGSFVRAMA